MQTQQINFLRWKSKLVSAPGSSFAGYKTKAPQLKENIIQVAAGNIMQCGDFSSLEAGVSCCYFMQAQQCVAKGRGEQAFEPWEPPGYLDKPIGDAPWETWAVTQML